MSQYDSGCWDAKFHLCICLCLKKRIYRMDIFILHTMSQFTTDNSHHNYVNNWPFSFIMRELCRFLICYIIRKVFYIYIYIYLFFLQFQEIFIHPFFTKQTKLLLSWRGEGGKQDCTLTISIITQYDYSTSSQKYKIAQHNKLNLKNYLF